MQLSKLIELYISSKGWILQYVNYIFIKNVYIYIYARTYKYVFFQRYKLYVSRCMGLGLIMMFTWGRGMGSMEGSWEGIRIRSRSGQWVLLIFLFFINVFIYFGCVGSSLLRAGFL